MEIILRHSADDPVRLAFPAIFEARAMANDPKSKPAYGGKLIIKPGGANAKLIQETVRKAAQEHPKWGANWDSILKKIISDQRSAWVEGPYLDGDGKVRDGFEGMYYLSCRSEKLKPTAKDRFNQNVVEGQQGAPYSGCHVHAAVDIYAFDNPAWGRRINCTLQGVMFADDGAAFGGGRPASDSTFAGLAAEPAHSDLV